MRETFIVQKFQAKTQKIIDLANEIIAEYEAQGFTLTLRQLYYQFVSRDLIRNQQSEYKRLGSIVNDARLAGLIDWSAIEDRTRNVRGGDFQENSPELAVQSLAASYAEAYWTDQPRHVEVWIEKDALIGVIERVCDKWRLPYLACRGYVSQSEQYSAGQRFRYYEARLSRSPVVLYLGDHDPSGMDMTRDHVARLAMFARMGVEVRRLALNMNQIEEYDPPPNPAKETDSRSGPYIAQYGESSWELDALEPRVIEQLIEDQLQNLVDHDRWEAAEAKEAANREFLQSIAGNYEAVTDFLRGEGLMGEEPEE